MKEKMTEARWALCPSVYSRLISDKSIPHGAFRFWHYLRDRAGKPNKQVGWCWPKQSTICTDLGCNIKSLPKWTDALVTAGFLETRALGEDHHLVYAVRDGTESPKTDNRVLEANGGFAEAECPVLTSQIPENGDASVEAISRSDANKQPQRKQNMGLERPESDDQQGDLPANLHTADFQAAWKKWELYNTECGRPLSPTGRSEQLKGLSKLGEIQAIATIEYTIFKGWKGLVTPPKEQSKRDRPLTGAARRQIGIPQQPEEDIGELIARREERRKQLAREEHAANTPPANGVATPPPAPERGDTGP